MDELISLEQWAAQTAREVDVRTIAWGIAKRIRREGFALSAVFHKYGRAFQVVEVGSREYRERLRYRKGSLIGVYTLDVEMGFLAEDVEVVL